MNDDDFVARDIFAFEKRLRPLLSCVNRVFAFRKREKTKKRDEKIEPFVSTRRI